MTTDPIQSCSEVFVSRKEGGDHGVVLGVYAQDSFNKVRHFMCLVLLELLQC